MKKLTTILFVFLCFAMNDGFCSVVRKAEVAGEIKNDKFVATNFKLLPMEQHKHNDHDGLKH